MKFMTTTEYSHPSTWDADSRPADAWCIKLQYLPIFSDLFYTANLIEIKYKATEAAK